MSVPLSVHFIDPERLSTAIADDDAWRRTFGEDGDDETPEEIEEHGHEALFAFALEQWPTEARASGIAGVFGRRRAVEAPRFLRLFARLLWSSHGDSSRLCDYPSLSEHAVLTAVSPETAADLLRDWDDDDFARRRGEAEIALEDDADLDWRWFSGYANAWIALLRRAIDERRALVVRAHG